MSLSLKLVNVATGSDDSEGQLVFANGFLVAVLVRLGDAHGLDAGKWFLEAAFGPVEEPNPPLFTDLNDATAWIAGKL